MKYSHLSARSQAGSNALPGTGLQHPLVTPIANHSSGVLQSNSISVKICRGRNDGKGAGSSSSGSFNFTDKGPAT